jgi:hypothetical protein
MKRAMEIPKIGLIEQGLSVSGIGKGFAME